MYWAQISASAPHATQRVHSVASCVWPSASFRRVLVATLNVVRAVPVAVYVTAGSSPRWPISCTRFRSCTVVPPRAPRLKRESKHAFRKAKATKTGVNGGKGTGGGAGRVHWSAAQTLAPEGVKPPATYLAQRLRRGRPCELGE